MIGPGGTVRVWAYPHPADLRKSYNGLYGLVTQGLGRDPLSGDLFLFVNRRRTTCKVLLWNFLFVGHDDAGHNLAVLQTIVATCRLHDVHPYDYIADLLIRTQSHPSHRLDELLPMNYKPPDSPSL